MPSVRFTTNFFLVLTIVADVTIVVAVLFGLGALVSEKARNAWRAVAAAFGPQALLVAWIVAIVTTLGSLYYSEHAGFVPCELCWYQRILMYPLVIVLGVGWLRRDRLAWITAAPFVVIGAPISIYHWLVERVPSFAESSSCSIVAPCTAPYFEKLGFVTLAWMALSSFLLIGVLLVVAALAGRQNETEETAESRVRPGDEAPGTVTPDASPREESVTR
jgi:disulfide bond formation protein DsbB